MFGLVVQRAVALGGPTEEPGTRLTESPSSLQDWAIGIIAAMGLVTLLLLLFLVYVGRQFVR